MKRICVNCGSSSGFNPVYMQMAEELGNLLVDHDLELVYGGAEVGLMGKVADTVLKRNGKVIGIIPKSFAHKVAHPNLTELHVVESMHERKSMMFEMSDGFVALPGGYGTLEEVTELLTWSQLGLNHKPCGIINVNGYFNALFQFFDVTVEEGFMKQEHRDMLLSAQTPAILLNKLLNYHVPSVEKWIG